MVPEDLVVLVWPDTVAVFVMGPDEVLWVVVVVVVVAGSATAVVSVVVVLTAGGVGGVCGGTRVVGGGGGGVRVTGSGVVSVSAFWPKQASPKARSREETTRRRSFMVRLQRSERDLKGGGVVRPDERRVMKRTADITRLWELSTHRAP